MQLAEIIESSIYCIHHLFEEQVRNTPDSIAVTYGKQKLNYYELNQLSNQLAYYLTKYVVTPNTQVAICVKPSLEMLIGLLGTLKAGGVYVPLSPNESQQRLTETLHRADVSIVLAQSRLKNRVARGNHRTICLDSDTEWLVDRPIGNNPVSPTEPANLACVHYTFEPNGLLKASGLSHKTLINSIQQQLKHRQYSFRCKTLLFSPITTVAAFEELFAIWFNGGNLVLTSQDQREDAFALWHFIDKEQINRLHIPLIALQQLIAINDRIDHRTSLNTVTEIVTSGDELQIRSLSDKLVRVFPRCKLVTQ